MTTIIRQAVLVMALVAIPFHGLIAQQGTVPRDDRVSIADWEELRYPPLAVAARIQGVVVVQVKLDGEGKVLESIALWGSKILIPDCLANAKKWRFQANSPKTVLIVHSFHFDKSVCRPGTNYSSHFELIPPNLASITSCSPFAEP